VAPQRPSRGASKVSPKKNSKTNSKTTINIKSKAAATKKVANVKKEPTEAPKDESRSPANKTKSRPQQDTAA